MDLNSYYPEWERHDQESIDSSNVSYQNNNFQEIVSLAIKAHKLNIILYASLILTLLISIFLLAGAMFSFIYMMSSPDGGLGILLGSWGIATLLVLIIPLISAILAIIAFILTIKYMKRFSIYYNDPKIFRYFSIPYILMIGGAFLTFLGILLSTLGAVAMILGIIGGIFVFMGALSRLFLIPKAYKLLATYTQQSNLFIASLLTYIGIVIPYIGIIIVLIGEIMFFKTFKKLQS